MTLATPLPTSDGPWPHPFGRYQLSGLLGAGGMGIVYRAFDTLLERDVALKVPRPELVTQSSILKQFHKEARTGAQFKHPNICRVLDLGYAGELPFMTMEYIEGRDLSKCRPNGDAWWDPWEASELVHTVACAMAAAHKQGIIHRDLKPQNIMIQDPPPKLWPVITDLGLALALSPIDAPIPDWEGLKGTIPYMPREQIRGGDAFGPRSDVYSLGVVYYELMTGVLPFDDCDTIALIRQILNDPVVPPGTRRPGIPAVLEEICLKAMARAIDDRYAGMEELGLALENVLKAPSKAASSAVTPPRRTWSKPWTIKTRGSISARPAIRTRASLAIGHRLSSEQIVYQFVAKTHEAPAEMVGGNRLFLDSGQGLREGVIDQRCVDHAGSTTSLVRNRPDLVQASVASALRSGESFTVVLHEYPDLDCVTSTYLAIELLTSGTFPKGDDVLAQYADGVDEGSTGMSPSMPHSLYPAFRRLVEKLGTGPVNWRKLVSKGVELVDFALKDAVRTGRSLLEVDAFACPGLFGEEERAALQGDQERYDRKLAEPATRAHVARLRLPGQLGGTVEVEALLIRDVQIEHDPDRCHYFEDWAHNDEKRCPNRRGFEALCVFANEHGPKPRECRISVTPLCLGSLQGLGALLEAAETARRRELYGVDDRVKASVAGEAEPPDEGSKNTDPWYDGHEDRYTIVKAPRSGTALTADELESVLLRFGDAADSARPLGSN